MEECYWDNERIYTYLEKEKINKNKYIKNKTEEDEMPFYMSEEDFDRIEEDDY